jgi:hypothetical protein
MEVHVEIDPVPKGLDGGDDPGRKRAPGHNLEVTAQGPEGAAAEIAEETAIELEEDPQYFHHLLNDRSEKPILPLETVFIFGHEPLEIIEE